MRRQFACSSVLLFLAFSAAAQTVSEGTTSLLAVEHPITAAEWLRAHPHDTFERLSAANWGQAGVPISWCALAAAPADPQNPGVTRKAFFSTPADSGLELPSSDNPAPSLAEKCMLSAVTYQLPVANNASQRVTAMKSELRNELGPGDTLPLYEDSWPEAHEWIQNGARWVDLSPPKTEIVFLALTAASRQAAEEAAHQESFPTLDRGFATPGALAAQTGLAAAEVQRMGALLQQQQYSTAEVTNDQRASDALFLMQWIREGRRLPPEQRAAALYVADVAVSSLPLVDLVPGPAGQPRTIWLPRRRM